MDRDYVDAVRLVRDPASPAPDRERAFGSLVEQFRGMVYSSAIGFLGDAMQADDAVQETFLAAWRHIGTLRTDAAFPGWLRRIVIWRCHYYRRADHPSMDIDELVETIGDGSDLMADAERNQLFAQVQEVLWTLSRPHREILVLHYLEHYSQAELALLLELSPGAVRKRLHDARQRVRGVFDRWPTDITTRRRPAGVPPWRQRMSARDTTGRTPQQKIDAMHRPRWCAETEAGRRYWDLVGASIRDDVDTIDQHLADDPDCARLEWWYTPPIHFAVREGNAAATQRLWAAYPYDGVNRLITLAEDRGHTDVANVLRGAIGEAAATSDLRLHEAVEAGDVEEIARLLSDVEGIGERRDPQGRTALHAAVIAGDEACVKALLEAGAPVDSTDHSGFRPVHYACWRSGYWQIVDGGDAIVTLLMDAGAADSPMLAARRGDLATVQRLVKGDASMANDPDTLGKRPLSAAVQGGHRDVVRFLLDHGADPTLPESRQCPHGSALMEASVRDELEMARWLLEAGADPDGYIDSSGTPTIRAASDAMRGLLYGFGGKAENAWGLAQRGELGALAAVLRYCEDPFSDEAEEFLTTPYTAVISGWSRKRDLGESTDAHSAMLEMFLRRKHPMPKVLTACKSYLYRVPHMTRQLLENGLDANLPDWLGRTPLHDICSRDRSDTAVDLVEMFLEHGADLEAIDEEDRSTPLGIAAREGDLRLVTLLLDKGADPNGGATGWSKPLAWATRRGHTEVADLLRSRGVEETR